MWATIGFNLWLTLNKKLWGDDRERSRGLDRNKVLIVIPAVAILSFWLLTRE